MDNDSSYYVYVYIDPRNHEEFYYGHGKGARKDAHLTDRSDTDKTRRIAEITAEGLTPLIRVIARGLTKEEALLVEKTLLWKLGKWTTNIATGHFARKFRPQNTLHKKLFGYDFDHGVYYFNVGECDFRNWDDWYRFGFISAGWGTKYRDCIKSLDEGDIVVAYLSKRGYVGVGRVKAVAARIRDIKVDGIRLLRQPLIAPNADHDLEDDELCEYVCLVQWIRKVPREKAKWKPKSGLFTTPQIKASLESQKKTISFVESEFDISFDRLAK
jgi:hypothetical protein